MKIFGPAVYLDDRPASLIPASKVSVYATELDGNELQTRILLPDQATGPQYQAGHHAMHTSIALIGRCKTTRRWLCLFGIGGTCTRDGEVVSLRTQFQAQAELFGLVVCDKKLSFSQAIWSKRSAGPQCGCPDFEKAYEPKR